MRITKLMTTSELAATANVGRETLRLYEEKGLLTPISRTAAGYRQYAPHSIELLAFIKQTQQAGFTLKEIQELVSLRTSVQNTCGNVTDVLQRKKNSLDDEMRNLQLKQQIVESMLKDCCGVNRCKP